MDEREIQKAVINHLRNADIMTIVERSVTTATDTPTLTADTTVDIALNNVKNIRTITVDATPLLFGIDWTFDPNFGAAPTNVCRITFKVAQTGDAIITYDFGADKIHGDMPRETIQISSYPRVAINQIYFSTNMGGFGKVWISSIFFTTTIFAQSQNDILDIQTNIRQTLLDNRNALFGLGPITPRIESQIMQSPDRGPILQKGTDYESILNYEK